uniref:Uncharacterized protein n=1 Tax=Plectus sambesii TaxID=2011161 RepID=A0A914V1V4_9BILA
MAETPNDVYNNHNNQGRMVGGPVHGTVNQGDQHIYYHNTVNEANQQDQGILDALTASLVSATHIANASDGPIWAKCDRDQAKLTCDSDILEGLSLGSRTQERLAEKGFCKINRGDFLKMIPPAPFWDRFTRHTTVYISVFHADEN